MAGAAGLHVPRWGNRSKETLAISQVVLSSLCGDGGVPGPRLLGVCVFPVRSGSSESEVVRPRSVLSCGDRRLSAPRVLTCWAGQPRRVPPGVLGLQGGPDVSPAPFAAGARCWAALSPALLQCKALTGTWPGQSLTSDSTPGEGREWPGRTRKVMTGKPGQGPSW